MYENGLHDEPLYNKFIIDQLPEECDDIKLTAPVTLKNPGENLILRPLQSGDYDRGYLQLLSQLTKVGDYSKEVFLERFQSMVDCKDSYFVTVLEDTTKNEIIGTATLTVEKKFIRNAGNRGRMEDVVVNDEYRGKQLGKVLVAAVHLLAKHTGCYKLTLDCRDKMVKYYQSMGFHREEGNNTTMTIRFNS